jgi:hypothetical protein
MLRIPLTSEEKERYLRRGVTIILIASGICVAFLTPSAVHLTVANKVGIMLLTGSYAILQSCNWIGYRLNIRLLQFDG